MFSAPLRNSDAQDFSDIKSLKMSSQRRLTDSSGVFSTKTDIKPLSMEIITKL
jgi:hypothetical protein